MYLFILESIGTSELLLIGLVALIVFGPRKLPELARMLGKAMNEFRRTTDDFKRTWEQEVNFENENEQSLISTESSVQRNTIAVKNEIAAPEIKEINQADFAAKSLPEETTITRQNEEKITEKHDWL